MQKQYGTNAKLFKCIYDNLLFYESLEICKTLPFYLSTCPKCKHKICYFCSRDIEYQYERGQCWVPRKLYYLIFKDSLYFFDSNRKSLDYYYGQVRFFIFPFFYFVSFVGMISATFYYRLYIDNKLFLKNKTDLYKGPYTYENHLNIRRIFILFTGINIAFAITLYIPYIFLDYYFKIFMFLISFIFKFYPMKWYTGIITANFNNL